MTPETANYLDDYLAKWQATVPEVENLWRKASKRPPKITPQELGNLAKLVMLCFPVPENSKPDWLAEVDEKAREHISALQRWTRLDRHRIGDDSLKIRDRRLRELDDALGAAREIASTPSRPWTTLVAMLATEISTIRKESGKTSENTHDVKFIALALRFAGHEMVTAGAVSKELIRRKSPQR
jgi:hypothetical protein